MNQYAQTQTSVNLRKATLTQRQNNDSYSRKKQCGKKQKKVSRQEAKKVALSSPIRGKNRLPSEKLSTLTIKVMIPKDKRTTHNQALIEHNN